MTFSPQINDQERVVKLLSNQGKIDSSEVWKKFVTVWYVPGKKILRKRLRLREGLLPKTILKEQRLPKHSHFSRIRVSLRVHSEIRMGLRLIIRDLEVQATCLSMTLSNWIRTN